MRERAGRRGRSACRACATRGGAWARGAPTWPSPARVAIAPADVIAPISANLSAAAEGAEQALLLELELVLKENVIWAEKGHVVAYAQVRKPQLMALNPKP